MSNTLAEFANRVAIRETDRDGRSMDPILINALVTQVLPAIIDCFKKRENTSDAEVAERIRELNRESPRRLRNEFGKAIRDQRQEAHRAWCAEYRVRFRPRDAALPKAELDAAVDAMIAEAIETPDTACEEIVREAAAA